MPGSSLREQGRSAGSWVAAVTPVASSRSPSAACSATPLPGARPYSSGHAAQVAGDGEHRDDDRGHEQRAVPAPGRAAAGGGNSSSRPSNRKPAQLERRGPTREDGDQLADLVGEQHRVDPQVDPEDVLDEEQRREHGGEQPRDVCRRRSERMWRESRPRR